MLEILILLAVAGIYHWAYRNAKDEGRFYKRKCLKLAGGSNFYARLRVLGELEREYGESRKKNK